jgi:hypothetical protein
MLRIDDGEYVNNDPHTKQPAIGNISHDGMEASRDFSTNGVVMILSNVFRTKKSFMQHTKW